MHTQIRLAREQGLLQGRSISAVQAHALYLFDVMDFTDRADREDREMNLALLATGVPFASLFPQYVPQSDVQKVDEGDIDSALNNEGEDTATVRYVAPPEEMTEERMNELLGQLMSEHANGALNGSDMRRDGWI